MEQLFVYGSLRSGFKHPAYQYLASYFDYVGDARVRGTLFDLGTYPAAVPDPADHWIIGELYHLKADQDFEWAIEQLDDYEGLHVEEGEQPLYRRELATVYTADHTTRAWIYWYNQSVADKAIIESGDTLAYFMEKQENPHRP
jgi:gamma-glutamylcyclotransferase (GGCT)/AIG2-like uncharacterized protein YtfP